jgi:hypothetical protein
MEVTVQRLGGNLFEVRAEGHKVLVSFGTPVAYEDDAGRVYVTDVRFSATTARHLRQWLAGRKPATVVNQEALDFYLQGMTGDTRLRGRCLSPAVKTKGVSYAEYARGTGKALVPRGSRRAA